MSKVVVDTNVRLSFLTDRDEQQQHLAAELLESAARGEHVLILHQLVDFADAGLTAVCRSGGYTSLATFDLSFSRAAQEQGLSLFW